MAYQTSLTSAPSPCMRTTCCSHTPCPRIRAAAEDGAEVVRDQRTLAVPDSAPPAVGVVSRQGAVEVPFAGGVNTSCAVQSLLPQRRRQAAAGVLFTANGPVVTSELIVTDPLPCCEGHVRATRRVHRLALEVTAVGETETLPGRTAIVVLLKCRPHHRW